MFEHILQVTHRAGIIAPQDEELIHDFLNHSCKTWVRLIDGVYLFSLHGYANIQSFAGVSAEFVGSINQDYASACFDLDISSFKLNYKALEDFIETLKTLAMDTDNESKKVRKTFFDAPTVIH